MKFICLAAIIVLPLLSAGVQAAEMDEITMEVIDARASSVEDVMRYIEIPHDHVVSEHGSESRPQMRGEHANVDTIEPTEQGRHPVEERGEDRRDSVEERGEDRRDSTEEHSENRQESVDELHEVDHEDAHD